MDLTKVSNGGTESGSVGGVAIHFLKCSASNAKGHAGQGQAFKFEVAHHVEKGFTHATHEVFCGDNAVVKHQFGGVGGAHTGLVVDFLTHAVAGHAGFDKEGGHLDAATLILTCSCIDPNDISRGAFLVNAAVGDPHFSAIKHPRAIVSLHSRRGETKDVRTGIGLRHGHGTNPFSGADFGQNSGLLLLITVVGEVVDKEHGVRQVSKCKPWVGGGQFLVHNRTRHSIQSCPPVFFRSTDA